MDPASVIAAVLGGLTVLGGVLAAGVVWGRKTSDVDALRADLNAAVSAFKEATKRLETALRELGRDVDQTDITHRERWHEHDRAFQDVYVRLARLEDRAGIAPATHSDRTPVQGIPLGRVDTGRHRKTDESG